MVTPVFTHDGPGTSARAWVDHPRHPFLPVLRPFETDDGQADRLVVVAAHPDDESLGAGGLLATAHQLGLDITLVLLTAGERSHPHSPTLSADLLATRRLAEADEALRQVAPRAALVFVGLPDGQVGSHVPDVTTKIVELVLDGRRTVLAGPWRSDGHPDHEAAGVAAAAAALRTGARLLEYPLWFWHWGDPHAAPWQLMHGLALTAASSSAKQRAVHAHRSQVEPLSASPGDEALLTAQMLAHFTGTHELFIIDDPADDSLDVLHRDDADPWGVDTDEYEQRKRDLTGAVLPRSRFRRGLEVGCSRGALAQLLLHRCTTLLAIDSSPSAVASATQRLADHDNVSVQQLQVPREWPTGSFDLIVVSEMAYFLSPRDLDRLIERIAGSLTLDGSVVLCHWMGEVRGWPLDGSTVHARFASSGLRPVSARYTEQDFEILLLSDQTNLPTPIT